VLDGLGDVLLGKHPLVFSRAALLVFRGRLLRAHAVYSAAMRDRHDPGLGRTASRIEPARVPPHFDHDLLGDLLGLCGIAQNPGREAVDGS